MIKSKDETIRRRDDAIRRALNMPKPYKDSKVGQTKPVRKPPPHAADPPGIDVRILLFLGVALVIACWVGKNGGCGMFEEWQESRGI